MGVCRYSCVCVYTGEYVSYMMPKEKGARFILYLMICLLYVHILVGVDKLVSGAALRQHATVLLRE